MSSRNLMPSLAFITFLAILIYLLLRYLQVPAGELTDWIAGIASFWWLMIIVTVPWNMHFSAKELLEDAKISSDKGIKIKQDDVDYAKKIARRFLIIALGLHIFSAIVLYILAYADVTPIGYIGSIAAVMLTVLRPSARLYEYMLYRLQHIRQELKYPREDVEELRQKVNDMVYRLEALETRFDPQSENSWLVKQENRMERFQKDMQKVNSTIETFKATNQSEHDRLGLKAESALSQMSEDAQFLNQVREIIRFFKNV